MKFLEYYPDIPSIPPPPQLNLRSLLNILKGIKFPTVPEITLPGFPGVITPNFAIQMLEMGIPSMHLDVPLNVSLPDVNISPLELMKLAVPNFPELPEISVPIVCLPEILQFIELHAIALKVPPPPKLKELVEWLKRIPLDKLPVINLPEVRINLFFDLKITNTF